jgi:oxygen-independent coproporphyrinogen-3 oxidase
MPGLYIHIPFCSVKCHYCDFVAFSGQGRAVPRYLDALAREADLRRNEWEVLVAPSPITHHPSPVTLYIGGGTPSELGVDALGRLLKWISRTWGGGSAFSESTFEANPESLDEEKAALLKEFGLTRISLGLQATQDRLLKALGRRHDWKAFLRACRIARASFPSVNVDLMFNLPGQSLADWEETLGKVLALEPDHVSLYGLKVEERTVFSRKRVRADEDLGAGMYERALDALAPAGYRHYEISNFARPGHESRHNLGYWRNEPYLGLGCGAASYLEGVRQMNEASITGYCSALEAGRLPVASTERLEGREKLAETLFLGLRQVDGMELSKEAVEEFGSSFERLRDSGLMELIPNPQPQRFDGSALLTILSLPKGSAHRSPEHQSNGLVPGVHARLTLRGLLLSNRAFLEFVPPFED